MAIPRAENCNQPRCASRIKCTYQGEACILNQGFTLTATEAIKHHEESPSSHKEEAIQDLTLAKKINELYGSQPIKLK